MPFAIHEKTPSTSMPITRITIITASRVGASANCTGERAIFWSATWRTPGSREAAPSTTANRRRRHLAFVNM